jgi:hypothetical protein
MRFYSVVAHPEAVTRWYLKAPLSNGGAIDPRVFTEARPVDFAGALSLPLRREGAPVDFNFADFDMVVTTPALIDELQKLPGVALQRWPVTIPGAVKPFEILNVLDSVDCIDEERSEFIKWTPEDGRADKVGEYRMFVSMKLDPHKAKGHHLFRLKGWEIALIASERVKVLCEQLGVTGVAFDLLT